MTTIFYIVMGGSEALRYYLEAYLSIRTFQKQLDPKTERICVLTDHPAYFNKAGVEVLHITAEVLLPHEDQRNRIPARPLSRR